MRNSVFPFLMLKSFAKLEVFINFGFAELTLHSEMFK